jgi:hypothetical protein
MVDQFYKLMNLALDIERKKYPADKPVSLKGTEIANKVSAYTSTDEWNPGEVIPKNEYAHIEFFDYKVTVANGYIYEIKFPRNIQSTMFDIFTWLDHIEQALNGTIVEGYDYVSPAPQIIEHTNIVEVDNAMDKAKAEILDKLLSRNLSIGEGSK